MNSSAKNEIRVSKRCPNCGWRVLDKLTPASGIIEVKCKHCGRTVRIDLSYRVSSRSNALRYRLAPETNIMHIAF